MSCSGGLQEGSEVLRLLHIGLEYKQALGLGEIAVNTACLRSSNTAVKANFAVAGRYYLGAQPEMRC